MFAPSTPPATGERLLPTIRPRIMVMQRDFQNNYVIFAAPLSSSLARPQAKREKIQKSKWEIWPKKGEEER
jgi:hypothetical protein